MVGSPDLDRIVDDLLARLAESFRLDTVVGGRPLGEVLAGIARAAAGAPTRWGSEGERREVASAGSGPLSFHYRPHLFPGMAADLHLGHQVQFDLLPRALPPASPLEMAAVLESYCHLSGDLLGWHEGRPGQLTAWLLDVSGHGIRAGFAAVVLKLVIADIAGDRPLDAIVHDLDRRFVAARNPEDPRSLYATGLFLRCSGEGPIEYVCAGHPELVVQRRDGGMTTHGATGPPIGLLPGARFEVEEIPFAAGETAVMLTDGLIEACDEHGRAFGEDRVQRLVAACSGSVDELADRLYAEVASHHDLRRLDDDLTFVVLRRRAGAEKNARRGPGVRH